MFKLEVSEQHLADQARAIRVNNWLRSLELERIKRKVSETDVSEDRGNELVQMNRS